MQDGGKVPGIKQRHCFLPVCLCQIGKMEQIFNESEGTLELRALDTDCIWYRILTTVTYQNKLSPDIAARLRRCPIKAICNLCLHTVEFCLI